jgi:hypothetical protein
LVLKLRVADNQSRKSNGKRGWTSDGAAPPNGMRLSCGAELNDSQTEFYHTARRDVLRDSLRTGADSFKRVLGGGE